ncbi:histone H2B isoform X2 [Anolis carolinensis]|uniref:histone H2B isoform X2 n=1 Tax=Anolis carolinensis TaxID=28377 RepID=UPI00046292B0|nr:PREDICTED: histone H2B isoform X2 [Anolis carolinensis]|eukprot:XP_008111439.1 PREDICTED: histone H2B isoform X2 [Anolis carolinensis]
MFAAHYTASFFATRIMPSMIPHQKSEGSTLHYIQQHKRKKRTTYSEYMHKVLKQVPQDTNKYCWALDTLRSLNKPHLYGMVALEASRMSHYKKKPIITSMEVHAAVRVVLLQEAMKSCLLTGNDMSSRHVGST